MTLQRIIATHRNDSWRQRKQRIDADLARERALREGIPDRKQAGGGSR